MLSVTTLFPNKNFPPVPDDDDDEDQISSYLRSLRNRISADKKSLLIPFHISLSTSLIFADYQIQPFVALLQKNEYFNPFPIKLSSENLQIFSESNRHHLVITVLNNHMLNNVLDQVRYAYETALNQKCPFQENFKPHVTIATVEDKSKLTAVLDEITDSFDVPTFWVTEIILRAGKKDFSISLTKN